MGGFPQAGRTKVWVLCWEWDKKELHAAADAAGVDFSTWALDVLQKAARSSRIEVPKAHCRGSPGCDSATCDAWGCDFDPAGVCTLCGCHRRFIPDPHRSDDKPR